MAGHFCSDPWEDEDWSGKGRPTYYMDLDIDHACDPDRCVILTTAELMEAIPDFDWKDSRSGHLLDEASAEALRALFNAAVVTKKDHVWSPEIKVLPDTPAE